MDTDRILDIQNLSIWYKTYRGYAKVVDDINFHVNKGEKVGLVGESGCGKTTTVKSILRILDEDIIHIPKESKIFYEGDEILSMKENRLQKLRREEVSMISQSPGEALNPVFTVGQQLFDIIKYSGQFDKRDKDKMLKAAIKAIDSVMISDPERIMDTYPHQLSGGMKQRICIAMSLVTPRELLIADEPGTALDVTIQDQIHRLLNELVEEKERSLIMITHSLGVARELVDRIYVMYAGNIIETCYIKDLFINPLHPYTKGLIECVPKLYGGGISSGIYGYIPDYVNPTPGCRFYPRCSESKEICKTQKPKMVEVSEGHYVACVNYYNE